MPALMASQRGHGSHLHSVQHRRDCPHIILAQQKPQQPLELVRFPLGLAQNVVHLLQSGQQNLPQLVQNLRLPVIPPRIQTFRLSRKPLLHLDLLQEAVQRCHLPGNVLPTGNSPAQPLQRLRRSCAHGIEMFQTVLLLPRQLFLLHLPGKAAGMLRPGGQPLLAPDGPQVDIILQLIAFVRLQRRHGRPEIPLHGPWFKIRSCRLQSRQHRSDNTFAQDVLCARLVNGDAHSFENQPHQAGIGSHIRYHQSNIPVAAAGLEQFKGLLRCRHGLLPGRIRLIGMEYRSGAARGQLPLEKAFSCQRQSVLLPR